MVCIKPKFRCATRKSIDKLAQILNVPNTPFMQDWEWEIADTSRLSEYLRLYKSPHMSEDDKFTLMETILQAVEEKYQSKGFMPIIWPKVECMLIKNKELHKFSIHYWSDYELLFPYCDYWKISKHLKKLYLKLYY